MSERYTKVFSLHNNLYVTGSPVIISAGALLKDNQTGRILAQLKFQNISTSIIKAISVQLMALDTIGKKLGDTVDYQYLDLHMGRDEETGQKVPILLPDPSTRAFYVSISEVIFSDNAIWKNSNKLWEELKPPVTLQQALKDQELVKQYRIKFGDLCKYKPNHQNDLWQCSCGFYNHNNEAKCHNCGIKIADLDSLNIKQLDEECEIRVKSESEKRLRKKTAKSIKRKKLATLVISVCIITFALWTGIKFVDDYINSNKTYNAAIDLAASGSYEEAATVFKSLGNFKDSQERAQQNMYDYAQKLIDGGDLENASIIFSELGDFKDSQEKAKECLYSRAQEFIKVGQYEDAISLLSKLGDYQDSVTLLKDVQNKLYTETYDMASAHLRTRNYSQAIRLFSTLENFKDSREQLRIAENELEIIDVMRNSLAEAYELMTTMNVSRDFKEGLTKLYTYCGQFEAIDNRRTYTLKSDFRFRLDFEGQSNYHYIFDINSYFWNVTMSENDVLVVDKGYHAYYPFTDSKGQPKDIYIGVDVVNQAYGSDTGVEGNAKFLNGNIYISVEDSGKTYYNLIYSKIK